MQLKPIHLAVGFALALVTGVPADAQMSVPGWGNYSKMRHASNRRVSTAQLNKAKARCKGGRVIVRRGRTVCLGRTQAKAH